MSAQPIPGATRRSPRTYLYVPGDREDMLANPTQRGADAVIADLEDAVPVARKTAARRNISMWLEDQPTGTELWVRVNSDPAELEDDIRAVADAPSLAGLVVAKVEDRQMLEELPSHLRLQPMIESARALLALADIASAPGVERLQLGEADLSADLGTPFEHADQILSPIRLQVVVTSVAARLESPVAPVSTNFRDLQAFERSTVDLRRLGFGARAVIHPAQVDVANRVFTPSAEKVEAAQRLLDAATESASGVFLDENGRMVDEAVLRSARRIVALAAESRGGRKV